MSLDVSEPNSNTPVNVSTRVRPFQFDGSTPYFFDDVVVTLSAATPTHLLLTTGEAFTYVSGRASALAQMRAATKNEGTYVGGVYYLLLDVGGADGTKVIDFHPRSTVSLNLNGNVNAALPQISFFGDPTYVKAQYVSDAHGLIYVANPREKATNPAPTASYVLPSGTQPAALYFSPSHLSTTETLIDGGLAFETSGLDVLANVPSSGSVQGSTFMWHSTDGGMAPLLRTVSRKFEEAQSRDEFLSGVALATAAAAFIALVQAGPEAIWPYIALSFGWLKRRRGVTNRIAPAGQSDPPSSGLRAVVVAAVVIATFIRRRSK